VCGGRRCLTLNYRDTAARLAGIAVSGVHAWLKAADERDARYEAVTNVIRSAEKIAEADSVTDVRNILTSLDAGLRN
jgi:hypothetical protein